MTMKTVKEILTEARDTIVASPHLLISGDLVEHNDENQLCFCSLGYIAMATGECAIDFTKYGEPFLKLDGSPGLVNIYDWLNDLPAVKALAEVVGVNVDESYTEAVYDYNDDHAGTRPEKIIEAFNDAIKALD